MTSLGARNPPILESVAELASASEAWICDIWGVIHNGVAAHQSAVDACLQFRARGGVVVLMTNAPRPAPYVEAQLARLGVPREAWSVVLTSGDLTRGFVAERQDRPLYHLGPDRDRGLFDGLNVVRSGPEDAEAVICSGLFDDETETPETYRPMLEALRARNVPMICANPDITVERGNRIVYCAGALADLYSRLGGPVIWAGKPHMPIYERAFAMIDKAGERKVDRGAILAIGDGVRTDIKGAASAGLRSVYVASAIHVPGPLEDADLEALFAGIDPPPVGVMRALTW
jgi:HAD superfamily hydrolase (TIGR01459 family)